MYSYFRTYVLFSICSRYPTPRTYIARKRRRPHSPLSEVGNAALAVHIMGNCCFSFFKSVVQLVLAYNLVVLFSVEKFIERISNDLVLLVALDVLDIRSSIDLCVAV